MALGTVNVRPEGTGGSNVNADEETTLAMAESLGEGPYEVEFDTEENPYETVAELVLDEAGTLRVGTKFLTVDGSITIETVPTQAQVDAAVTAANEAKTSAQSASSAAVAAQAKAEQAYELADGKAEEATYTVDVPVAWVSDETNGGYTQTISVAGILESDNPIWDLVLGTDPDTNDTYEEAYALIDRLTTANGSITLWANGDAPTTAITVQLKVVR